MKPLFLFFAASLGMWTTACASLPANPEVMYGGLRLGMTAQEVEKLHPKGQWNLEYDPQSGTEDLQVMTIPGAFLGEAADFRILLDKSTGRVGNIAAVFYRKNHHECRETVSKVLSEMSKRYGEPVAKSSISSSRKFAWHFGKKEELLLAEYCVVGENIVAVSFHKVDHKLQEK